jgi:hypothetical protein
MLSKTSRRDRKIPQSGQMMAGQCMLQRGDNGMLKLHGTRPVIEKTFTASPQESYSLPTRNFQLSTWLQRISRRSNA